MEAIYLDTHVVVWLYQKDLSKFSNKVLALMENNDLLISPMVVLELELLNEIGRLTVKSSEIISELQKTVALKVCDEKFSHVAHEAIDLSWTRDPFDRLIVANSLCANAKLISKDRTILKHCKNAVW